MQIFSPSYGRDVDEVDSEGEYYLLFSITRQAGFLLEHAAAVSMLRRFGFLGRLPGQANAGDTHAKHHQELKKDAADVGDLERHTLAGLDIEFEDLAMHHAIEGAEGVLSWANRYFEHMFEIDPANLLAVEIDQGLTKANVIFRVTKDSDETGLQSVNLVDEGRHRAYRLECTKIEYVSQAHLLELVCLGSFGSWVSFLCSPVFI